MTFRPPTILVNKKWSSPQLCAQATWRPWGCRGLSCCRSCFSGRYVRLFEKAAGLILSSWWWTISALETWAAMATQLWGAPDLKRNLGFGVWAKFSAKSVYFFVPRQFPSNESEEIVKAKANKQTAKQRMLFQGSCQGTCATQKERQATIEGAYIIHTFDLILLRPLVPWWVCSWFLLIKINNLRFTDLFRDAVHTS